MYKSYLKYFILFFALFCIPLGSNWLFLLNSGELLSVDEIVKNQFSSQNITLVGLATRNQGYYYKKVLFEKNMPSVLVLGSSRVMQFRQSFFNEKMITSGGAMSSLTEGFSYINEIFNIKAPKIVIIGLDYWWFNENESPVLADIKPPIELSSKISLKKYILPYIWLWKGKISLNDYFRIVNPKNLFNSILSNGIGVDAILNKTGFGPDGSYYYTKNVIGKEKSHDERFNTSLNNIENSLLRFGYGEHIHTVHLKNFINLINYIESFGTHVILFIPPMAPTVVDKMNAFSENYKFIDELRYNLSVNGLKYFDFHDPRMLNTSNCEFIDGIHGGDVVYARILKYMAERSPMLKNYLNIDYLDNLTSNYGELAMIPNYYITNQPEIDFLKLGCSKIIVH